MGRRPTSSSLPGCLLLCLPFLLIGMDQHISQLSLTANAEAVPQDEWNVKYTPRRFCSLIGSSLTMRCKYTSPVGQTVTRLLWFRDHGPHAEPRDLTADPQFKGRVQYFFDNHNCTVRLTDLTLNDSGTYSFMFTTDAISHDLVGLPGVSVHVTDLGVQVDSRLVQEDDWPLLTCGSCSLSDNPTYTWFKDKRPLTPRTKLPVAPNDLLIESAVGSHSGNYSCAVPNKEADHNLGVTLKVGYSPRNTKASLSGGAAGGGLTTLSCESVADPPAGYTWHRESAPSAIFPGQNHTIRNTSSEDVGRYRCEARNVHGKGDSQWVEIKGEHVDTVVPRGFLFLAAVVGGVLLVVAAFLVLLHCSGQKLTVGRRAAVQDAAGDSADDTYTALDTKSRSPDYDILENVKWKRESDTVFEETPTTGKHSSTDYENTLS